MAQITTPPPGPGSPPNPDDYVPVLTGPAPHDDVRVAIEQLQHYMQITAQSLATVATAAGITKIIVDPYRSM